MTIFISLRTCAGFGAMLLAALAVAAVAAVDAPTPSPASALDGASRQPAAGADFWSFRPIARPIPPASNHSLWPRNDIDRFVLAKLQSDGLKPAPEASKAVLIRRASFDLTGLPPTPQEVREFLADKSPDAYERLVDRLLASPHYGERWGRHWLDVARYVQGRITFPGAKKTSGDQPYRDYVVRAFNSDKPYDLFVTEQLAGDLLPTRPDRQEEMDRIIAPAFLSIGSWFDMETDPNRLKLEMVDEMINTTSKAFLGLSVACARCHDHKFDPIPTADYYALAGIFGSTRLVGDFSEYWRDGRVRQLRALAMPGEVAFNDRILAGIEQKKSERWKVLSDSCEQLTRNWKTDEARYRLQAGQLPKPWVKRFEAEDFDGQHNLRIAQLSKDGKGTDVIETLNPADQWVKYKIEVPETAQYQLEAFYSSDDATPIAVQNNGATVAEGTLAQPTGGWELSYQRWRTVATFEMRAGLNFLRLTAKAGNFPRLDRFRLIRVDNGLMSQVAHAAAIEKLQPALLQNFVIDPETPWPTVAGIADYLEPAQQDEVKRLTDEMSSLESTIKPYDQTIAVTDQLRPSNMPVHVRGDTYQCAGAPVNRGVPRLLEAALPSPTIPASHSGRLEFAHWMTDAKNPLVARVMVNRIWQGHFGRGLVATPSDFGTRGEPPTHPELLDWLASRFVENGWSIKQLHRLILTSSTYRMSGEAGDATIAIDPDNAKLTRFPPRRLEAEAIFDAMLCTVNKLVKQEPSKPLDIEKSKDRGLYILTSGRSPAGLGVEIRKMFTLFDYDATGAPIAVRPTSTTPAQSLFWLNSPIVKYYADKFAERLIKMDKLTDPKRVEMAYLLAFGHPPSTQATAAALQYIAQCQADDKLSPQDAWSRFCQALYGSNEFRYVE